MIQKVENKTIERNVTQTVKLLLLLFFITTSLFAQVEKTGVNLNKVERWELLDSAAALRTSLDSLNDLIVALQNFTGYNDFTNNYDVFLPDTIYMTTGISHDVFFDNLGIGIDPTTIVSVEPSGAVTSTKWSYTPSAAGIANFRILFNDNSVATSVIKISTDTVLSSNNKMLAIGDSRTYGGLWISKLRTYAGDSLTMLGNIGTAGNYSEGYSGKSYEWMTTNVLSPFVFDSTANLWDSGDAGNTASYYVIYNSGLLAPNASYIASDYIEVLPNKLYRGLYIAHCAFYDMDSVYIGGTLALNNGTFTSPAYAKYVRFSVATTATGTATLREIVKPTFDLQSYAWVNDYNDNGGALFHPKDANNATGYYVNWTTGALAVNASYTASHFIPVNPSTDYYFYEMAHSAWYDSDSVFISGQNSHNDTLTSPSNAAFLRYSALTSTIINSYVKTNVNLDIDNFIVRLGTNDVFNVSSGSINAKIAGVMTYIDSMVTNTHRYAPNAKIGICLETPPPNDSLWAITYAAYNRAQYKYNIHLLNKTIHNKYGVGKSGEVSYVKLIPIYLNSDKDNDFYTNGVHETIPDGYNRNALYMWGWLRSIL